MKGKAEKRVLLIEDDAELLLMMAAALDAAGYAVASAADGRQGLKLFAQSPVDLVVTDMIMPVKDGVETITALKETDGRVKIIAISGGFRVGPLDYLALARHMGADETLAKPFSLDELVAAADRLLSSPAVPSPAADHRPPGELSYELVERLEDAVMLAKLLLARLQPDDDHQHPRSREPRTCCD